MLGIRSTSHLTTPLPVAPGSRGFPCIRTSLEDEVPRTLDDDDEVTLESLPENDGAMDSISEHPNEIDTNDVNEDGNASSSLLSSLSEQCSIQLLKSCVENELVSAIDRYYQKKGMTKSLKTSFREVAFDMPNGAPPYWKFDFTCPIDGTLYHSSLPGPLFDSDSEETIVKVAKKVFGEYVIVKDRQVVFLTKRAAKRSVALVALLELGAINLPQERGSSVSLIPTSLTNKRHHYPNWVNQLYRSGISGSDLNISYHEEYQRNTEWNCQPIYLRCVLEIEHPEPYIIEGDPQPTKQAALHSAVGKVVDKQKKPMMNGVDNDLEAKQRILTCESNYASYIAPLPASSNSPLPNGEDADIVLYVYELEFEVESLNSFVHARSAIGESTATPLGIAFTQNMQPAHHCGVYETQEFFVPRKNGEGAERVVVRLRRRAILHVSEISGSKATVGERIYWMEEFNRTLHRWKTYGNDRRANKISETIEAVPRKAKTRNQIELSPFDRTYFFLPLTTDRGIDWALLQRVASYTRRPYVKSIDAKCRIPCLAFVPYQTVFVGLAFLASGLYSSVTEHHIYEDASRYHRLEHWMLYWKLFCGFTLLAVSFLARLIQFTSPPKTLFTPEMLENHFLVQTGAKNTVYVACGDMGENYERLTGLSSFPTPGVKDFAEYYQKKYGTVLRHPRKALLPCMNVDGKRRKHSDYDFLLLQQSNDGYVHLAPELVYVLPMPRHFMYLARHAKDFMPLFEREIQLASASEVIRNFGTGPSHNVSSISSASLCALLAEATTLAPAPTYQRLEFLGDAVLAFFVAVVIMARNSALKLAHDEIERIIKNASSNRALFDAALRIGAPRLLYTGQCKWRSAFSIPSGQSPTNGKTCHVAMSDRHLSDVVESLLGAMFVYDRNYMLGLADEHSDIAVSLVQKLQLSLSCNALVMENGFSAYDAISPCLKHGYPFEKDVAWQCQLSSLGDFLDSDEQTLDELETRRKSLMNIFDNSSGSDNSNCEIASKRSRTLLFCAFFHDGENENTSGQNADNGVTETGSEEGMRHLLNFREMLHLVGANSLQLCITTELYKRYPKASEGDMHIMRACAINDDVVVYIMMKAGIHATVYRMDPKTINRFQLKMMVADGNGSEVWKARGGWILKGGVEEYARRRCCGPSVPQYVGIAGGRLHGNKGKLPLDDTEELMFTMKAIIGALVLATGMDFMWQYIGPLFEELLLLSADELTREYGNHSTIFSKS